MTQNSISGFQISKLQYPRLPQDNPASACPGHDQVFGQFFGQLADQIFGASSGAAIQRLCAIPLMVALMSSTALSQSLLGGDVTGGSAGAIALGTSSFSTSQGSIAIGAPGSNAFTTRAAGPDSLAIGNGASALNAGSIAHGAGATAGNASGLTSNDIAIGNGAAASGGNGLAAGNLANASGPGGVALGNGSIASGLESFAGGNGAWATGSQATALGNAALAAGNNSVSVGNGSAAAGGHGTAVGNSATAGGTGGTALGDRANAAGPGTVSIGRNSTANQAGSLAIGDNASSTGNRSIALGAGALASSATVIGGGASGTGGSVAIGENASASGILLGTAIGNGAAASVAGGVALGAGALSDRPAVPGTGNAISVAGAHGNISVGYNTTDRALQGGVSIGNATQYRQLQNVADGQDQFDAANVRELRAVAAGAIAYTDTATQNLQGQISTNAANIAINTTNIETNRQNITANTAQLATHASQLTAHGNQLATHSGQIANLDTQVTEISRTAVRYTQDANGNPTNAVTLTGAGNGGPVIIHNLAAGVANTDAANTGQVREVERIANNSVQYERDANGARTNIVSLQGGNPNAPVRVRNVAAGIDPTDAVNLAQMQDGDRRTLQQANSYTDNRVNNLVNLWDERMRGFDRRIFETGKQASAGTALALAASSLRYADVPGKWTMGGGAAVYRGQLGLAFGLGHTSDDGRWRFNSSLTVSPTQSRAHVGVAAGISYVLN